MKKVVVVIIIFSTLISCNSKIQDNLEVYFFEQQEMNSIIALGKKEYKTQPGLRKIEITQDEFKIPLTEILNDDSNIDENYVPDIRYVLVSKSDTIFFDYNGNYITSDHRKGKVDFIPKLDKMLRKNISKSKLVTSSLLGH